MFTVVGVATEGPPRRIRNVTGANGLAQFFLVDHSLRDKGGHHFDYVSCIARAAKEMGFDTTIGCHQRFRDSNLPNLRPTFRQTTYQPDSYLAGLQKMARKKSSGLARLTSQTPTNWLGRTREKWNLRQHHRRRQKFIHQFATDCSRFFNNAKIREGDHAFFTTVSELELLGLSRFLAQEPGTLQAHWHLQFHFNMFEGRTPEYERQNHVANAIRSCFDLASAKTPYHRLHYYTTSALLAEQYERLSVGNFEVLPYPVADCFRPNAEESVEPNQPLRFTCPGAIRREKGHIEYLQPLVDKIWEPHLNSGKLKLVVQRPAKKLVQGEKIQIELPRDEPEKVVEYLPHPLPPTEYANLIRSTDCGLLFYDSRTYFSRRAGVMGELLSCGRPVIVSAGSWLAEQIKEANFDYVDSVMNSDAQARTLGLTDLDWSQKNVPLPGGIVSFDDSRCPFECSFHLEEGEAAFCILFDWHWPRDKGVYARIEVHGDQNQDNPPMKSIQTIGHREAGSSTTIFRLNRNQTGNGRVKLRFSNAFHDSMASIQNLRIVTLSEVAGKIPIGTVGIVAADESQLPNCIDEMVEHYDHYRSSAGRFALQWYSRHEPRRTVAHLLSVEQQQLRAA